LAVRVAEYFVTQNQLPQELLQAVVEIARSSQTEDLADSATQLLEKAASTQGSPALAAAAKTALSEPPARLDVHAPAETESKNTAAISALARENVVVREQSAPSEPVQHPELRYYRQEDAEQARAVASSLERKGLRVELRDRSKSERATSMRPRRYDLLLGSAPAPAAASDGK
jgi:hypothetical protein